MPRVRSQEAACIRPIHSSIYGKRGWLPRDMERLRCSQEQIDAVINIAMSIFADCTNVGVPFQNAIMAVYLSGLNHGLELSREKND